MDAAAQRALREALMSELDSIGDGDRASGGDPAERRAYYARIISEGEIFTRRRDVPDRRRRFRRRGACYEAATTYAQDFPDMNYCEGIAGIFGHPRLPDRVAAHAWVVDDDGVVIDRSRPYDAKDPTLYIGIRIEHLDLMTLMLTRGHYGPYLNV